MDSCVNRRQRMELRVDEILTNGLTEDLFVEFKRQLPDDHRRAARRIAALANAARGTEVVWLVGVDNDGTVVGVDDPELSNWWAQVQRCFDDVSPDMSDLIVARPEGRVLALFFATDRAPYLWKTGGSPELEVPWRDGTRTRPACRSELLRLLRPQASAPDVEVIRARLTFGTNPNSYPRTNKDNPDLFYVDTTLTVQTFIDCNSPVSFPTHRQVLQIRLPNISPLDKEFHIAWRVEGVEYPQVPESRTGTARVEVPSIVTIEGYLPCELMDRKAVKKVGNEPQVQVHLELHGTGGIPPYITDLTLGRTELSTDDTTAVRCLWAS